MRVGLFVVSLAAGAIAWASACSSEHTGGAPDAAAAPFATPTPIRYVLVLVKENHTFDNYFADYPGVETTMTAPLSDGGTIARPQLGPGPLPSDLDHTITAALAAYADGGMNGFDTIVNDHGDPNVFGYYPEPRVALYHALAREFVLCDHFFTNTLGPSFPGHLALVAAQSPAVGPPTCTAPGGCTHTDPIGCDDTSGYVVPAFDPDTCTKVEAPPCFDIPTVVDRLPAGATWRAYAQPAGPGDRYWTPFRNVQSTGAAPDVRAAHYRDDRKLVDDLASGDLANVTYAEIGRDGVSEHPPEDICPGEQDTGRILEAAMKGPHWNEMAIVVTWDDWGGFYDHVAPPVRRCANGHYVGPGFRVPALIVSPYARKGYVLRTPTEQASVPRLVAELFGMPFLTTRDRHARDAEVGSLMEAFDFAQPPRPPVPLSQSCP